MQQRSPAMTSDELSLERGKSFVKALQELKNLRPQLYSAAEYCEKSYMHNEQKQMVLDNLKDYAVRALVNAVDHLGTVAYKLTDLFDQQTVDISTVDLKIACLNQRILTCQTYTDNEGLRQQQMMADTGRHHKHYILPSSGSKRIQGNLQQPTNIEQNRIQAKPHPHHSGIPASKTLSWLLASETSSPGTPKSTSSGDSKTPTRNPEVFHLMDAEDGAAPLPLSAHLQSASGPPSFDLVPHTFGVRNHTEVSRPMSAFRSFENSGRRELSRPLARSKSMLSAFFAKSKTMKQKKTLVS